MISPDLLPLYAEKALQDNEKFCRWLKHHIADDELDELTHALHNRLFAQYDCSTCRNCCKLIHGYIPKTEIQADAAFLGISEGTFRTNYLGEDEGSFEEGIETRHLPCDFFTQDQQCMLGDHRPEDCKTYPFTGKPQVMSRLYSIVNTTLTCPVSFEIFEQLKRHYRFRSRRR